MSKRDTEDAPRSGQLDSGPSQGAPSISRDEGTRASGGPRASPGGNGERGEQRRPLVRARDVSSGARELPVDELRFRQDETCWDVRVLGRSGGLQSSASLLLLGFWSVPLGDASDTAVSGAGAEHRGAHEREALVAGTSLAQLGEEGVRVALARSRLPAPPSQERSAQRPPRPRRRGRGGR